jgi:hypothetical protein
MRWVAMKCPPFEHDWLSAVGSLANGLGQDAHGDARARRKVARQAAGRHELKLVERQLRKIVDVQVVASFFSRSAQSNFGAGTLRLLE